MGFTLYHACFVGLKSLEISFGKLSMNVNKFIMHISRNLQI